MKITSKHYKAGTRCEILYCCTGTGNENVFRKGEVIEIIHPYDDGGPEVRRLSDNAYDIIPVQLLKRIKPAKPEPPALKVGDWYMNIGPMNDVSMEMGRHKKPCQLLGIDDDEAAVQFHGESMTCYVPIKHLTPCAPPPTVPDGCPVDEQCHREMTAAGWKWGGDAYTSSQLSMDLHLDGGIYFGLEVKDYDDEQAGAIITGWNILAAWRERSNT